MATPEELPLFGPDPSLKRALPQEGEVCPPSTAEAPALTVGVGPSAGAQATMNEAMPEGLQRKWDPQWEAGPEWMMQ
jgi:hypothetical protein